MKEKLINDSPAEFLPVSQQPCYRILCGLSQQQLVHPADKLIRIFQRAFFGKQRLVQQQLDPLGKACLILSIGSAFH